MVGARKRATRASAKLAQSSSFEGVDDARGFCGLIDPPGARPGSAFGDVARQSTWPEFAEANGFMAVPTATPGEDELDAGTIVFTGSLAGPLQENDRGERPKPSCALHDRVRVGRSRSVSTWPARSCCRHNRPWLPARGVRAARHGLEPARNGDDEAGEALLSAWTANVRYDGTPWRGTRYAAHETHTPVMIGGAQSPMPGAPLDAISGLRSRRPRA